jgi:hypothetical protein
MPGVEMSGTRKRRAEISPARRFASICEKSAHSVDMILICSIWLLA